jgi:hypothetical protein
VTDFDTCLEADVSNPGDVPTDSDCPGGACRSVVLKACTESLVSNSGFRVPTILHVPAVPART